MQEDDIQENEPEIPAPAIYLGRKRNESIHMKILVPSGAVGAIIGKAGKSIAQVQLETGARIKLSKPNDFYPGTTERVCLIQGSLDGVTRIHNYIMDRMLEKPECVTSGGATVGSKSGFDASPDTSSGSCDPATAAAACGAGGLMTSPGETMGHVSWPVQAGSRLPWGRHQQVKILVPNCTAGLVIGKLGSYVKEIKDRTKAFIQISQKSREVNLLERCITIAGEPDQCRAAVALVLAKIAEDPQSTSCPTISYSRIQGPVASSYPTGSPFALASTCASRQPLNPGQQAPRPSGTMVGPPNYMAFSDPYMSPVLHAAAFMQAAAAAAALNARSYYSAQPTQPSGTHAAFMNTSSVTPPSQQQPQQQAAAAQFASLSAAGEFPGHTDLGLYATALQPQHQQSVPAGHLIASATGSQALWPGCEFSWGPTGVESTSTAAGSAPGNTQSMFETAYQNPFNFAYYGPTQPVLAPVASRLTGETFPLNPDMYSAAAAAAAAAAASSYGGAAIPFTCPPGFRPASPGPIYAPGGGGGGGGGGGVSHTTPLSPDTGPSSSKLMGLSPQTAFPLADLFGTLRLGPHAHPHPSSFYDYSGSATGELSSLLGMGTYSAVLPPGQTGSGQLHLAAVSLFEPAGPSRQSASLIPIDISSPMYPSVPGRFGDLLTTEQSPQPVTPAQSTTSSCDAGPATLCQTNSKSSSSHFSSRCDSSVSFPSSVNPSSADPAGTTSPTSDSRSDDVQTSSSMESPLRSGGAAPPPAVSACSSQPGTPVCVGSAVDQSAGDQLSVSQCSLTSSGSGNTASSNDDKCSAKPSKPIVNGQTTTTATTAASAPTRATNGVRK